MHRAEFTPRFKKQILSHLANSCTQKADIKHIYIQICKFKESIDMAYSLF